MLCKHRKYFCSSFRVVCVSIALLAAAQATMAADASLVLHNGKVYTADPRQTVAQAVAVKNSKIVAVGDDQRVMATVGPETLVIDLAGRAVVPGFIESHGHLVSMGHSLLRVDVGKAANYAELVRIVAAAAEKKKPGTWILGHGWHQSKWRPAPKPMVKGFQTHHALSAATPHHPVFLTHASGHAAFANAKAMELAGISTGTRVSGDGEVIVDDKGEPTGIFTEGASGLVSMYIMADGESSDEKALDVAIQRCIENGVTSFHQAGAGLGTINLFKSFLARKKLKIRLYAMLWGSNTLLLSSILDTGPEIGLGNNFLTIRGVKLMADGALGSRGAWLKESYADRSGHFGHQMLPPDYVYQVASQCLRSGFQVSVHAIGDRTNSMVLDQFERAFKAVPGNPDHRFRIEHAQHLSAADIPRFKELGVIASMQAIHMASDIDWAIHRLGADRIAEGAYVWRKLLDAGAMIINGTDTPIEPVNPIANFYVAVTRRSLKGGQQSFYHPEQRMTRQEALRASTRDAAYGAFEEGIKGTIEVGKLADLCVLSRDIMTVPEDQILGTRVAYTIIDGQIQYQAAH